jgi:PAS domain S-box-containing protein
MTESGSNTGLEKSLAESELRLRQVIDAMPHMVWMATLDGNCDFLSKRWEEYTGIALAVQLGTAWTQQLHPDDRKMILAHWQHAVATSTDFRFNCRIRRYDGAYRWFETRGLPLRDPRGHIVKWFGTNTDVHETYEAREALAANEGRLRHVTLATHDSVYDWDMQSGYTYRNEEFQSVFGAPPKTRSSDRWWENRIHPDDRKRVVDSATAAFQAHELKWSDEYRLRRADDRYATVQDRAFLLYDVDGKPSRMIGAIADITGRKEAEQSLRDARARLVSAMEAGGLGTWIWDVQTNEMFWDEATCRLWGRRPGEFTTFSLSRIREMVHPEDLGRLVVFTAEFRRTGIETAVEFRTLRPDGALQWVLAKGAVAHDASGQPIRMAGVYIDITERKQAEQSLRDAQDRLLSAMEAGGLATWIWDIHSNEIIWDDATCRLWGRPANYVQRMSMEVLLTHVHPDDREIITSGVAEFSRTGVDTPVEFRTMRPDGALQWLLVKGQIQRDASGQPIRMAGVYVDITDRKRVEEAQLRTQKMEALGTLAGGIAHDFNNILLSISGNAKLAVDDLRSALPQAHSVQGNLAEISRASVRAADLVRRILTFSRQQETQREVLQLRPLIEDALRLLRPTLPTTIDIRTAYDETGSVATDSIQIHQVVMNLVTNAAHAIGERQGAIDITLQAVTIDAGNARDFDELAAGPYACLTIRDNGMGVDSDIIDRIFDPFFTTKPVGQGTGLGLAVVHGIVKAHGGAITINSESGKGTTFSLYFPVAAVQPNKVEQQAVLQLRGKGEHVLYVDDEEALVFLISRVLERLGYRVTGCVDPEQALKELRADPRSFDVVVTDLSMRGMNGFELTDAVRGIRADLPVLLTSGYLRLEDREMAQQAGIREMILKPNTVEELGLAIDRTLTEIRTQAVKRSTIART